MPVVSVAASNSADRSDRETMAEKSGSPSGAIKAEVIIRAICLDETCRSWATRWTSEVNRIALEDRGAGLGSGSVALLSGAENEIARRFGGLFRMAQPADAVVVLASQPEQCLRFFAEVGRPGEGIALVVVTPTYDRTMASNLLHAGFDDVVLASMSAHEIWARLSAMVRRYRLARDPSMHRQAVRPAPASPADLSHDEQQVLDLLLRKRWDQRQASAASMLTALDWVDTPVCRSRLSQAIRLLEARFGPRLDLALKGRGYGFRQVA